MGGGAAPDGRAPAMSRHSSHVELKSISSNQPTKSWLQSNASARKHSAHYAVNFGFM
jgi:hypothetical protein